jgi:hypothetical protein
VRASRDPDPLQSGCAPDAEALTRSPYGAYVRGDLDYLRDAWHAFTRPVTLEPLPLALRCRGLQVRRYVVVEADHAVVEGNHFFSESRGMSDDYIYFVPTDPRFVPGPSAVERAVAVLEQHAPRADEIGAEQSDGIRLFDAGANFETVNCPTCRREIDLEWWQDCLDRDADGEHFRLASHAVPCCGAQHSLDQLVSDWPQAFGRFALVASNADIGRVDDALKVEIEKALETKVTVVYQHL